MGGGGITYVNGEATWANVAIGLKGVPSVAGGTASITRMKTCTLGWSNVKSGFSQSLCN